MGSPDEDAARTFVDTDLRKSRFVGCDLSGAVMRGVDIGGADIDAPWLFQDHGTRRPGAHESVGATTVHDDAVLPAHLLGGEWEHLRSATRDLDAIAFTEQALSRH